MLDTEPVREWTPSLTGPSNVWNFVNAYFDTAGTWILEAAE